MLNCSVIIVNYNTGALLQQVIDKALSNKQVAEVLVVDNNSTDNSMELLKDNNRLVKYYRKENHGFGPSCNYAANKATSDYLLFLNPDCIVTNLSIDQSLAELDKHKHAAIIGCLVLNPDDSEQRATRRRLPTLWRSLKTYLKIEKLAKYWHCFAGVNLNHQAMPKQTQNVEAINGAFILIKTEIFKLINGFDEKYPMHFEDLDLFKRTIDTGNTILFNPNCTAIHHQGLSSQSNPKVAQLKKQGLVRYFNKHGSNFSSLMIKLIAKIV